jgi:hypothetical protein
MTPGSPVLSIDLPNPVLGVSLAVGGLFAILIQSWPSPR